MSIGVAQGLNGLLPGGLNLGLPGNLGQLLPPGITNLFPNGITSALPGLGVPMLIPNVMSLEWRQTTDDIQHRQMNGPTLYANLPRGWEGSIEYHRGDPAVEIMFFMMHEAWLSGGDPPTGTLVCRVTGTGGGVFTFTGVAPTLEEGGVWRGDDATRCRIRFSASRMLAA